MLYSSAVLSLVFENLFMDQGIANVISGKRTSRRQIIHTCRRA
jgi:hypothetical protein